MAWYSFKLLLPAAVAGIVAMQSAEASACSPDPCANSDRWYAFSAAHSAVATDGVLVFHVLRGHGGALSDEEALQYVTLEVTDADGIAVPGQLELVEGMDLIVFRPDQALTPGAELTVAASIDNDSIDAENSCGSEPPEPSLFAVGPDPLPELSLLDLQVEQTHEVVPSFAFDTLVCCDGAYPSLDFGGCFSDAIWWPEGFCTAHAGTGQVRAELPLPGDLDPAWAANLVVRLVGADRASASLATNEGTLVLAAAEPFEAHYEIVDLARQESLAADPATFGEDVIDQLGEQAIDVTATLTAECAQPAYTCELDPAGQAWDPEACEPWEPEGETEGGSDSDTEGGSDSDTEGGSDSDTDGGSDSDPTGDTAAGLDDDEGGCACTADSQRSRGGALLSLLALSGLASLRRRRRRSR